jgi:hypothetical protein
LKNHFKINLLLFFSFFLFLNCFAQNNRPDTEERVKIDIIGDSQHLGFWESLYWDFWGENNIEKTKALFREIANRDPQMLVHLGDMTAKGASDDQWRNFDEDNKPVIDKKIPYYPLFGNHEYFGNEIKAYINYFLRFPHLKNKKWYSLYLKNTGLIMLNSNFDILPNKEGLEQNKWYLNELENMENNPGIKFICVFSHHPPYTNSKIVNPSEEIRNLYAVPFQKHKKTAFFFSGHCHSYEKFIENGKYFIVSGGGGGPRQKLNIDKNSRIFDDKYDGPTIRFFHFCELLIGKNDLDLKIIRLNDNGSFDSADEIIFTTR